MGACEVSFGNEKSMKTSPNKIKWNISNQSERGK